ncbi:MAG: hypothetical protein WKF43_08515 [Acidimicrobiales bacterium]
MIVLVVRRLLSGRHDGPFITDEAGYLGNARWLADGGSWLMDTSPYYRWGYSVLLTPIEWLSDDPGSRFQIVHGLNLVLVASVFPLLYALLRCTRDARPGVAALAAAVGSLIPGLGAADGMAMAENLLIPLYLLALLALWGVLTGTGAGRWWFGLSVLALWATHRRMVVVVALALLVLGVAVVRDRERLRPGVVNAAVLVAGLVPVRLLDQRLLEDRWLRVRRPESMGGGPLGCSVTPESGPPGPVAGGSGLVPGGRLLRPGPLRGGGVDHVPRTLPLDGSLPVGRAGSHGGPDGGVLHPDHPAPRSTRLRPIRRGGSVWSWRPGPPGCWNGPGPRSDEGRWPPPVCSALRSPCWSSPTAWPPTGGRTTP